MLQYYVRSVYKNLENNIKLELKIKLWFCEHGITVCKTKMLSTKYSNVFDKITDSILTLFNFRN